MICTKKILIIRGWRSKKEHWQETKEIFQKEGFEVLIPDLPGISQEAEEIKKPWSVDDYKDWILKYTKDKGWLKFNLIGHSFGGAIATKLTSDCPEAVEKLILCAPAVVGTKSPKTILFYLTAQAARTVFFLPPLKDNFSKIKEKLSSRGVKDYYFESGVRKKILKKNAKENHKKNLKKINKETLILWGARDDKISSKYATKIKELIPKSRIIIFPKIKHSPHRENSKEFSETIINFVK